MRWPIPAPEPLRRAKLSGKALVERSFLCKWLVKKSHKWMPKHRRQAARYLTFAGREPNPRAALIDVAAHRMQMAKQNERLDRHYSEPNM
jgi:hypothetical protein